MTTNNTNPIEEMRQNAIDSFFSNLEMNEYKLQSAEARACIHETADSFVPTHYDTLIEVATAPFRNNSGNFFLLAQVESGLLGRDITAADVLNRAIYEFLRDEIQKELDARIEEEEEEEEED